MHLEESKRTLMRSDLFQGLKETYVDLILMICEEIRYLAGDYVVQEGDPGDAIFLLAQGAVEVVLEPHQASEDRIPVAVMAPTSTFGEVTLVEESGKRAASVRCRTDSQLIRIPRDRLLRLCSDYPEIGYVVMRRIAVELANKLRSSNVSIREYHLFPKPLEAGAEGEGEGAPEPSTDR